MTALGAAGRQEGANGDNGAGARRAVRMVWLEPGEKAVVIPDIHNKWPRAEEIIADESPDRIIFLGDYFDDFEDTTEDAEATAAWLAKSLADRSRVHLAGNHDVHYMSDLPELRCSGHSAAKRAAIAGRGVDWSRLEPCCWLGQAGDGAESAWLCTHAGLSAPFLESVRPGPATAASAAVALGAARADLDRARDPDHPHPFLQAGSARGGLAETGGIVWCDYRLEFRDVPGLRQIFGHTPAGTVRHGLAAGGGGGEHYCIDTALGHYIAYKDGAVTVRSAGGS